jgi:hypothetical protein
LFLLLGSAVIVAVAVVLGLTYGLVRHCFFGFNYLPNDDILDERECGFFESLLLHEISDLSFDMGDAGDVL